MDKSVGLSDRLWTDRRWRHVADWSVPKPIEQSFQQLKQFTADASHELRSPLAAIKTSVEVLHTHRQRFASEDAQMLGSLWRSPNVMGERLPSAANQESAVVSRYICQWHSCDGLGSCYSSIETASEDIWVLIY